MIIIYQVPGFYFPTSLKILYFRKYCIDGNKDKTKKKMVKLYYKIITH